MICPAHPEPLRVRLAETRQTVTIQAMPCDIYKCFFIAVISGKRYSVYVLADGSARAIPCAAPKNT